MTSHRNNRRLFRVAHPSVEQITADVRDELSFHIESRTEELVRTGMTLDEARHAAESEFTDDSWTRRSTAGAVAHYRTRQRSLADLAAYLGSRPRYVQAVPIPSTCCGATRRRR